MFKIPVAYTINYEGLKLEIALIPTKQLLIHEETIQDKLEELKRQIVQDGYQASPILVDRKTYVVLDGMHRIAVMKELGCRFTCVCLLDYFDPSIKVHRWCRIIPKPFNHKRAQDILKSLDLEMDTYELVKPPSEEEDLLLIFKDHAYKVKSSGEDPTELFRRIYKIETMLNSWGYEVVYCTESEAIEQVEYEEFEAAIYPPKVSKKQVIDVAEKRNVFTPKATRHQLPARPVQVNVPLELLRDKEISIEEVNIKLKNHLKRKKVKRYDPGMKWHNRVYNEVLYVFED